MTYYEDIEKKAKIFTLRLLNITEEKFDLVMLNYNNELLEENVIMYVYTSHLAGLNVNAEHIIELEKENEQLSDRLKEINGCDCCKSLRTKDKCRSCDDTLCYWEFEY